MWVSPDGVGHVYTLSAALEAKDSYSDAAEWLRVHYPATWLWLDLVKKNPSRIHRESRFDLILAELLTKAGYRKQ